MGKEIIDTKNEELIACYSKSTTPFKNLPKNVEKPETVEQVVELVKAARKNKISIHPISIGNNWGYGSAMAATKNCSILDLSEMNKILEFDNELGYVVIQPGVTQGQLQDYLALNCPHWWMDANGAGPSTSIVGNILQRGFGHSPNGQRSENVCGFEVVLGSGEIIGTGFTQNNQAKKGCQYTYKHTLGPSVEGLFYQSNNGIVTKLTLWLQPVPKHWSAFFCPVPSPEIGILIAKLAALKREGVVQSTVHIGNAMRSLQNIVSYPWEETKGQSPVSPATLKKWQEEYGVADWTAMGAVYGDKAFVQGSLKMIKRGLTPYSLRFLTPKQFLLYQKISRYFPSSIKRLNKIKKALNILKPAMGLLQGRQTKFYLTGAAWRSKNHKVGTSNPHQNGAGLIWVAPLLPATAFAVEKFNAKFSEIYHSYGFDFPVTFTIINGRSVIATTNISYNKSDAQDTIRATACFKKLCQAAYEMGFPLYRSGLKGKDYACTDKVYWRYIKDIKKACDPDNIINPSLYQ